MATRAPRTSTNTLVRTTIRGDKELRQSLRQLQRDMGKAAKAGMLAAVNKHAVPAARAASPSVYASNVVAFATTRSAGITVRGARSVRRTAGYLEHGGHIAAKGDGYLTFQVRGQWVRVRVVSRPIRKRGRYILPTIMSDRIRRRVMRQLGRELTPTLNRIVRQAGGTHTPATA
jgi:hypothetical protein